MKTINKILSYNLIFIIVYRVALDWHYFILICPRFGITFRDNRTSSVLVLSWAVLIASYFLIKKFVLDKNMNLSGLVIYTLFLISFVPFTTCIYAGMATRGYIIYNIVYWIILFICWKLSNIPIRKCDYILGIKVISKRTLFVFICIIAVSLIIYVSGRYAHFRVITNLFSVYDIRAESSKYSYSTIIAYLFAWTVAINPLILGICFIRKKWSLVAISLIVQMLSFGINGRKSTFFMPFLVISLLIIYRSDDLRQLKNLITVGVSLLTVFGGVEYFLLSTTFISDFGIRRVMFIPNQLGEYYYDFFTTNAPDFFRSSFLRHFGFKSPYQINDLKGFTYLISDVYFGKPNMNSNNGLASDGLANLGISGCILMPILLVIVLRLIDKSSKNLDKRLLIILDIYISYNLLSTTLMTCLLTHGFIMLIFILPLISMNVGNRGDIVNSYDQEGVT